MSEEERDAGRRRRQRWGVRPAGIKAMVEAQVIKGQDIISARNAYSAGGHMHLAEPKNFIWL